MTQRSCGIENKPLNFSIVVASLPDREQLVAEIYFDNIQWVEISDENLDGNLIVQFYQHPKNKYWEFSLDEALKALEAAKQKLLGIGGIKS